MNETLLKEDTLENTNPSKKDQEIILEEQIQQEINKINKSKFNFNIWITVCFINFLLCILFCIFVFSDMSSTAYIVLACLTGILFLVSFYKLYLIDTSKNASRNKINQLEKELKSFREKQE